MFKIALVIGSIFSILIFLLFSTSDFKQLIVVKQNNISKQAINIEANKYKDRYCNMTIKEVNYSAQAILENNDTLFFDDIGCLILWLDTQKNKDNLTLWIWAQDTKQYINARDAWYSQNERTPMHYGFGAYKNKKQNYIDFNTVYKNILKEQNYGNH
jgi:hypothetical protein